MQAPAAPPATRAPAVAQGRGAAGPPAVAPGAQAAPVATRARGATAARGGQRVGVGSQVMPAAAAWAAPRARVVRRAKAAPRARGGRGRPEQAAPRGATEGRGGTAGAAGGSGGAPGGICGNGILEAGETCDDLGTSGGDGCSSSCQVEAFHVCPEAGKACELKPLDYLKASNADAGDEFGSSVALSADGLFLAVGSPREASAATGASGNQQDQSAKNAGAVYLFVRNGTTWSQQAYLKASNTDAGDFFGDAVALSADGSSLVVGAPQEDSSSAGVNGDQGDNSVTDSGAAYVFVRSGATWTQQAYLKATSPKNTDVFGRAVTISADGNTVGVAAPYDTEARGAVHVFTRKGSAWGAPERITASNPDPGDEFGVALSLAGDGQTLVVGGPPGKEQRQHDQRP
jgi:cysteine-rich repeat protein